MQLSHKGFYKSLKPELQKLRKTIGALDDQLTSNRFLDVVLDEGSSVLRKEESRSGVKRKKEFQFFHEYVENDDKDDPAGVLTHVKDVIVLDAEQVVEGTTGASSTTSSSRSRVDEININKPTGSGINSGSVDPDGSETASRIVTNMSDYQSCLSRFEAEVEIDKLEAEIAELHVAKKYLLLMDDEN